MNQEMARQFLWYQRSAILHNDTRELASAIWTAAGDGERDVILRQASFDLWTKDDLGRSVDFSLTTFNDKEHV
jgi:hypothetical protein